MIVSVIEFILFIEMVFFFTIGCMWINKNEFEIQGFLNFITSIVLFFSFQSPFTRCYSVILLLLG
ncbi:MAG: hypothetical protein EAX89_06760 [Candidatus Lokiarchaeota archaeon]|nr:hypothetical protein [Candidatus Lokiarchaeota archaeon]